jgi:hypothetical protein
MRRLDRPADGVSGSVGTGADASLRVIPGRPLPAHRGVQARGGLPECGGPESPALRADPAGACSLHRRVPTGDPGGSPGTGGRSRLPPPPAPAPGCDAGPPARSGRQTRALDGVGAIEDGGHSARLPQPPEGAHVHDQISVSEKRPPLGDTDPVPPFRAFSTTAAISSGAIHCPFLMLRGRPVAAAARIRSVWRQRKAGICRTSTNSAAAEA